MKPYTTAILTLLVLSLMPLGAAQAFVGDRSDEARGMVVFSIPFGGGEQQEDQSPALSLHFGMQKDYTDYGQVDRFDQRSGARLPDFELESLHRWSLGPAAQQPEKAGPPAGKSEDR